MAFKFVVLAAVLAYAQAGLIGAPLAAAPAVAYSAAPAVSSVSYSSPLVSYGAPLHAAAPAITSQHSNILRTPGNLGQISTYSKTIDTPFSSVSKSDVRVSNPGLRIAAAPAYTSYSAPVSYAAPALSYAAPAHITQYAAPAQIAHYAAPAPVARIAAAPAAIGVAYSAAPAVSHVQYSGVAASYGW